MLDRPRLKIRRWTDESYGAGGEKANVSAQLNEIPVFYLGSKEDIFSGNV